MFTTGQLVFAIIFLIGFIIAMVITYRKDAQLHKRNYKGSIYILVGFLLFIAFLVLLKFIL